MEARRLAKDRARRLGRAKKRIAALETEIATLEEERERLTWRTADPEVCRDGEAARSVEAERVENQNAIETRYAEWERIATEVEAVEAEDV